MAGGVHTTRRQNAMYASAAFHIYIQAPKAMKARVLMVGMIGRKGKEKKKEKGEEKGKDV